MCKYIFLCEFYFNENDEACLLVMIKGVVMKTITCKMIIMLLFLTVTSKAEYATSNTLVANYQMRENKGKESLSFIDCLPSTLVSSIVGAFTGGFTRYLEKEFRIDESKDFIIFLMIAWWLEYKARRAIINELEQDFIHSNIMHNRSLMNIFSWSSSWYTYLKI